MDLSDLAAHFNAYKERIAPTLKQPEQQYGVKKGFIMICNYCEENEAEGHCDQCGEPVCEDCCVVMTLQNQIDYPLCLGCGDKNDIERQEEAKIEWERQEKINVKKEKIAAARKKAYWKPEAVEKRRMKKIEDRRLKIELSEKQMKETVKIVSSMFRGMF